jgi:catalase
MLAAHMVMWVMSDRGEPIRIMTLFTIEKLVKGIPRSFRMMQGFGVNTYTLLNGKGERYFVKFHLIPELGVHSLVWDEALKLSGQDPGSFRVEKALRMS